MAPKKQNHKKAASAEKTTQHAHLSDEELLNTAPESLSSQALLRLTHRYTEREIFDRMNAVRPNSVKAVHNIHCRIYYAMGLAAKASGRTIADIRAKATEAREKGVQQEEEAVTEISALDDSDLTATEPKVRFSHASAPE